MFRSAARRGARQLETWPDSRAEDRATSPVSPLTVRFSKHTTSTVRLGFAQVSHPLSSKSGARESSRTKPAHLLPSPSSSPARRSRPSALSYSDSAPPTIHCGFLHGLIALLILNYVIAPFAPSPCHHAGASRHEGHGGATGCLGLVAWLIHARGLAAIPTRRQRHGPSPAPCPQGPPRIVRQSLLLLLGSRRLSSPPAAQYMGFKMSPSAYLSATPLSASPDLLRGLGGANYASGGSGILDNTGNGTIPLREQVQLFAKTKAAIIQTGLVSHKRLEDLLAQSLFLISSGGNDLAPFDIAGVPMSQAPEFIADVVAGYIKCISELYKLGARKLALLDLLPAGCVPSQRAATADGECHANGNSLSAMFNALLRTEVAKSVATAMPCLKYSINSLYNAYSDMIANPAMAGLREVKRGCCGGGKFNGEVDCTMASSLCGDRDEYLFWDKVHGTQAAYRWSVLTFFNGTTKNAEPINLVQLMQEPLCTALPPYSTI